LLVAVALLEAVVVLVVIVQVLAHRVVVHLPKTR
jgi:hypothetical protein